MKENNLISLQFLESAGQLVGATGASAVALDSFKTGYDIGHLHAGYESAYALQVAVAAASESYATDAIGLSLYVYEFRADKGAGLEGGVADSSLGYISQEGYVKHIHLNYGCKGTTEIDH